MPSLLILGLLGAAKAATPVLIAAFEAQDDASRDLASRLPGLLWQELSGAEGLAMIAVEDCPPVGDQPADLYLQVCPRGQVEGCSYVLAGAAGARLALTGTVRGLGIEPEVAFGETAEPELEVMLRILDVAEYRESLAVPLTWTMATEATFTDDVPLMLQDVVEGLIGAEIDIRRATPRDEPGRAGPEPEEEVEDLLGESRPDGASLTTAPHREKRPTLTLAALIAQRPEEPWEDLGISAERYLAWWNSGWDHGSLVRRLAGRRGQVLLRAHAGLGLGPTHALYYGRISYYGPQADLEQVHASHELASGWGSQLGIALGIGLTPWLEVEAGASREGGRYGTDVRLVYMPDGREQARQISEVPDGTPQVWAGVRWVPLPERGVRPSAALGAACWWGEAASAEELPPGQDLPVFSPPTLVSLRLAPGAELRLAERVDLVAQAPLHLLLAGAAPVVDDQRYLEGTPGMSDLREPGRPVPLAFGLTAGAQVRLGGRAANPRAPRLGEDELD